MHYGLELPIGGAFDPLTLAELASLAEGVGWDGVFLEDYIVYHSALETYDPWVALATMALHTERIRLGTCVTPLSRRRPWKLARETVTIDHLSNGRLTLGVGLGDVGDAGFSKVGESTDAKERARRLDEALDVLAGLWSGKSFSYDGKYYRVENVTFLPRPVQNPRIPIWVGGGWPLKGPMLRAARWDGVIPYKQTNGERAWHDMTPNDVRTLKAFIKDNRSALTPFDIAIGGRRRGPDWDKERELIKSIAEAGGTWWMEWIPPNKPDIMRACIERGPLRID